MLLRSTMLLGIIKKSRKEVFRKNFFITTGKLGQF